jgi:hypothetical protein
MDNIYRLWYKVDCSLVRQSNKQRTPRRLLGFKITVILVPEKALVRAFHRQLDKRL